MIKVLFFARIREQLGTDEMSVPFGDDTATLGALQQWLVATGGSDWDTVLGASNVLRAVNQEEAGLECALADGDEVAFFPPVTGG